ncbi:unnamed protein product [Psylliodes chrysocephalus]|uniref:Uncharacterized protein n=1 Tax=Psylliodes chrysocephalus TaxID=3402493 RepID=A0A9P0CKT1_9CUCU|nr:unnamed protein product [Psylliodes chrysocephala]
MQFQKSSIRQKCSNIPCLRNEQIIVDLKKKNIVLHVIEFESLEVELLLGAEVTGVFESIAENLVAIETHFGWTVMGKSYHYDNCNLDLSFLNTEFTIADFWNLELLGIKDTPENITTEKRHEGVLERFKKTIIQQEDKRFVFHGLMVILSYIAIWNKHKKD